MGQLPIATPPPPPIVPPKDVQGVTFSVIIDVNSRSC